MIVDIVIVVALVIKFTIKLHFPSHVSNATSSPEFLENAHGEMIMHGENMNPNRYLLLCFV